jgi:hypothetical protein
MSKGSTFPAEGCWHRDAATGARVRQVTSHPSISHPSYFLHSSFLPGDQRLIFTSYRTGSPQLFAGSYPEGDIVQLTAGAPIHPFSPLLDPAAANILFVRAGSLNAVDLGTLEERVVFELSGAQFGEPSVSADGEWLTAAYRLGDERGLVAGRTGGGCWRCIPFPRTVIHPQFHPLEPEWIEFAADPAPRMHRVRRDGSGMECLYEHGNDEFVVHETFLGRTGDLVFTIWPRALCRMEWSTRKIRTITEYNVWHIAPNRAGTLVLCDTNHPDQGLQIVNAQSGQRGLVCLSESSNRGTQWTKSRYALAEDFAAARSGAGKVLSWMEQDGDTVYGPQYTHPHPSWSTDERKVAFASDRTGSTQVYVAELPAEILKDSE